MEPWCSFSNPKHNWERFSQLIKYCIRHRKNSRKTNTSTSIMMFVLNVLSGDFKIFQPFLPWWWASHFQLVTIDFLSIFHYGLKNFGWSKWLFPCQGACHWPVKTGTTKRINEGRRNMNKGGWNQVMAVWPQKILIYLFGHFGPWNWNLICLLLPIGRVSQIDWSKNDQVTNCFFLALFGTHLHPRNVYFPSNVSLWQILLPRSPMPSMHFQHLETNRPISNTCVPPCEKTPQHLCLADGEGPIFFQACSLHFQSTQGTFTIFKWAKKGRLHEKYRGYHIFGKLLGYANNEVSWT